jgi:hypothetical protein
MRNALETIALDLGQAPHSSNAPAAAGLFISFKNRRYDFATGGHPQMANGCRPPSRKVHHT